MPSFILRSPATNVMRSYLPLTLGTARDLALHGSAEAIITPDEKRLTLVSDGVSELANLVPNKPNFFQDTAAERPTLVFDADLGRDVISFSNNEKSNLALGVTGGGDYDIDYTNPFTMFALVRKAQGSGDNSEAFMGYFNGSSDRAALFFRPTTSTNIQNWYGVASGSANPQEGYTDGEWNLVVGSYDGTDTVSVSVNGSTPVTGTASAPLSGGQPFYLGQPGDDGSNNLAPECLMDAAGLLNIDALGSSQASVDVFNLIKTFASNRLGDNLTLV